MRKIYNKKNTNIILYGKNQKRRIITLYIVLIITLSLLLFYTNIVNSVEIYKRNYKILIQHIETNNSTSSYIKNTKIFNELIDIDLSINSIQLLNYTEEPEKENPLYSLSLSSGYFASFYIYNKCNITNIYIYTNTEYSGCRTINITITNNITFNNIIFNKTYTKSICPGNNWLNFDLNIEIETNNTYYLFVKLISGSDLRWLYVSDLITKDNSESYNYPNVLLPIDFKFKININKTIDIDPIVSINNKIIENNSYSINNIKQLKFDVLNWGGWNIDYQYNITKKYILVESEFLVYSLKFEKMEVTIKFSNYISTTDLGEILNIAYILPNNWNVVSIKINGTDYQIEPIEYDEYNLIYNCGNNEGYYELTIKFSLF